mgnify:CR=1 FL=1
MPRGYAICGPKSGAGLLPWNRVDKRMATAHNYWVGTTRPDGRPHVMPVWGVWVDQTFFFGTDRGSRKGRNLAANPALVVHLESGDDVVILEGVAEQVTDRAPLAAVDDAYFAKYRMRLLDHPGDVGIYALEPGVAFAWQERDFNRSATRWLFASD